MGLSEIWKELFVGSLLTMITLSALYIFENKLTVTLGVFALLFIFIIEVDYRSMLKKKVNQLLRK